MKIRTGCMSMKSRSHVHRHPVDRLAERGWGNPAASRQAVAIDVLNDTPGVQLETPLDTGRYRQIPADTGRYRQMTAMKRRALRVGRGRASSIQPPRGTRRLIGRIAAGATAASLPNANQSPKIALVTA